MPEPFIHLRVHTAYSLLEGAMTVKKLVDLAVKQRIPAIGIADNHNLFGSLEFSTSCIKAGIQPIIGCQFSLIPAEAGAKPGEADQLLLIASNHIGYQHLLKLVSQSYLHPETEHAPLLHLENIASYSEGLIALSAGIYGGIGKALLRGNHAQANELTGRLHQIFGDRFYIELMRHGLKEEQQIEQGLLELASRYAIPIVATNDVYFHNEEMYHAHDALICTAEGRYVMEEERRRLTPQHRLKTMEEMRVLFADLPEAIINSAVIARRCAVMSECRDPILPRFEIREHGVVLSEADALRKRAHEGLQQRLEQTVFTADMDEAGRETAALPYRERLEYELEVIISMEFPGYFLIVSDFITWSKQQGIPVGPGRGSGAASVVAWSLLITDLDPLKYDLVFERFLNPERVSMPDFDIDFCQDRRDEVIRYVQQKYGRDRVAQIITFGKLQARAVLRDVGRVLQMPYGQVDKICKLVPNNPANPVTLEQAIEIEPLLKAQMQEDETVARLIDIALKLEGLYRHASTHAAGVVIGDRPLDELVPLYRDPKSEMPVVQYSMKYAEMAGLVKFDFLGLKTLTVLDKAVRLVNRRVGSHNSPLEGESGSISDRVGGGGTSLDLSRIPLDDANTFDLLKAGRAIGVFQFESAGMRDALRKLQPDRLEDLIALGALYRPGPMDNIPTYIARKHGREVPDYLHPSLKPVLEETYGVIIYQEQVQKIAQILSGYTLGGADLLRRAMGKKIKEEMDAQRKIFVEGAEKNHVSAKQANEIFDLVAKFAGYGFNKAHAAAYALIGYQTAYLKANHPVEFFAASMTYDMHNTDKLSIFKQDMEQMGYALLPPDINASEVDFSVEMADRKPAVRYALSAIKNVGAQAMQALVAERQANGDYTDIFDVVSRAGQKVLNRRQLEHLVMAGVFDSLHPNRKQLFDSLDILIAYGQGIAEERASSQVSLFGGESLIASTPDLKKTGDWPPLERLDQEYKAIGFYLSAHPLEGYKTALSMLRLRDLASISQTLGSEYTKVRMAGIVMGKKIKSSAKGRFAFVQLSDNTGVYEASIFNEMVLDQSRDLLEAGTIVMLVGEAKLEEAGPRIIIQEMRLLDEVMKTGQSQGGELTLHVRDAQVLSSLKSVLSQQDERGYRITLHAALNERETGIIRLACRYHLTPESMLMLAQMNGVEMVKEKTANM